VALVLFVPVIGNVFHIDVHFGDWWNPLGWDVRAGAKALLIALILSIALVVITMSIFKQRKEVMVVAGGRRR
jgi:hypothetical protein